MLIDITLPVTPDMLETGPDKEKRSLAGHLGTHFDGMGKEFPLEYTLREGLVFDVSAVGDGDIGLTDIPLEAVEQGMFVAFYTGYIEAVGYGKGPYFKAHPQLSDELIDCLLEKGVSLIGVDFAGIRRGREHTPKDQYCADRGTFVIENLCGLKAVLDKGERFIAHTYPMRLVGVTGLPCRVIAEV